jgi:hypothetical protein
MTKSEAIKLLQNYIDNKCSYGDIKLPMSLPIVDEVIFKDGFTEWSFKGLIKIAYDLTDNI